MADETLNPPPIMTWQTWAVLAVVVVIGIPVFIVGTASAIKFVQFLNTPIISGSVPMWVVILIVTLMIVWFRKSRYG